jgi:hypothetical protein
MIKTTGVHNRVRFSNAAGFTCCTKVWSNVIFADPQSITVNAVAQSLARIGTGVNLGQFAKDDGAYKLIISHEARKRQRRQIAFTHTKLASDVYNPTMNTPSSQTWRLSLDAPLVGYTITEQKQQIDGFLAWLSASSGAKLTQWLGGEA